MILPAMQRSMDMKSRLKFSIAVSVHNLRVLSNRQLLEISIYYSIVQIRKSIQRSIARILPLPDYHLDCYIRLYNLLLHLYNWVI